MVGISVELTDKES